MSLNMTLHGSDLDQSETAVAVAPAVTRPSAVSNEGPEALQIRIDPPTHVSSAAPSPTSNPASHKRTPPSPQYLALLLDRVHSFDPQETTLDPPHKAVIHQFTQSQTHASHPSHHNWARSADGSLAIQRSGSAIAITATGDSTASLKLACK